MKGLKVGDSRRTRIEAKRAYGERSDEMLVSLAVSSVPSGMDLNVGSAVNLSNGMKAMVTEMDEREVRLDANHELAGQALTFDMELMGFEENILQAPTAGLKRAVFGLGCFWGKLWK